LHAVGGFYTALRAKIVGDHQDAGGEGVIGTYLSGLRSQWRIGFEGGLGVIKRPELAPAQSPELEAIATLYFGWRL
jgi:hypothetical protein